MTPQSLTAALKEAASRMGFDLVGASPAVTLLGTDRFLGWLADGFAGEMSYLANRASAYSHPRHILPGVRSVLMLAASYRTAEPAEAPAGRGRISRYAWGDDYHDVLRERLHRLADLHRRLTPEAQVRGVVDTAPLLEREFAQLAGLGWIGKNTLLLNRRLGSWFFLAALLTTAELEYDAPLEANYCGTCRACLDACPTGALVEPYRLDARRCISYLTIELRGSIPPSLRERQGSWLFGCDVCQDVCPWNRRQEDAQAGQPETSKRPLHDSFLPAADANPIELAGLFLLDDAAFRQRFRHTPLWRPRRRGLLRNAAIVLGNQPHTAALPSLARGLHDAEPLVRAACAWALGRFRVPAAHEALKNRLAAETEAEVRAEIEAAIRAGDSHAGSQE